MTLHPRDLTSMPEDSAALADSVLGPTNPYRVLGDQLADLFTDVQFAALYLPHGRAAVSPSLLALVTIFQFLENVPDRQAAELVRVRLDWKYALHLSVADPGFDFSCLSYFRRRLLRHEQEKALFETVLQRLQAMGLVRKRGKQRTDSIAVLGAVKELSSLETVSETLRLAIRALGQAAPGWVAQTMPAAYREAYERSQPDYQLSETERAAARLAVGVAGYWLLDHLHEAGLPEVIERLDAIQTLRTVWAQRFVRVEGQVQVCMETVDSTERLVTPHDPGVRAGQKRGKRWHGEKAHVTETAEEGQPNFITNVTTGNASGGDAEALAPIREQLAADDLLPAEQYVDSGYVSGKQLAESEAEGIALLGPPLADTSPNGFKIADFTVDWEAQTATCPAGQTSVKWRKKTERDGSQAVQIQFASRTCASCPLRAQCTTGTTGRSVHINEHHALVVARRAEAQTQTFRRKLWARSAIEATLSELVRAHGFRRHRYRGDRKRHAENCTKAAACNLKRLLRVLACQTEPLPPAVRTCSTLPANAPAVDFALVATVKRGAAAVLVALRPFVGVPAAIEATT